MLEFPKSQLRLFCLAVFPVVALVLLAAPCGWSADISEHPLGELEGRPVDGEGHEDRVVVGPEPQWGGWGDRHDGWHPGGPRIDVWVDRGEWSTYRPGDRLWVFFRVDRPCYVTVIDYAPDGSTDILFPSRWSGSNFARPGQTYRIPESRRYSLRIAGPGGIETLVACAHEAPWPSGPGGHWTPPYRPRRGRVVVGRPGGHSPPGRDGPFVVPEPHRWPVPVSWYDHEEGWGCDSVSFRVEAGGAWWDRDEPWDHYGGSHTILRERFRMGGCSDQFYRDVYYGRRELVLSIQCIESSDGDPTEIVGRLVLEDGWRDETLLRIDVEGRHGEAPTRGRVFVGHIDGLRVEVEIDDFELERATPWKPPRIDWIRFDVRVYEG